ncbi:MAG: HIT domain-containing protein [Dehalococcoidia bacterium]|nr:HIT domain-containing protein [Dehalococcoidia bacterium]
MSYFCVFCEIIDGREPADIRYQDEHVIVFKNRLNWVPVMLLAVPKRHMTQGELWTSDAMVHVARAAAEQGDRFSPAGFRLLSNFGTQAMQSQVHAHIHVLGGAFLGEYA